MSSTPSIERTDSTEPATGKTRHVAQHAATERPHRKTRTIAKHALHPVVHVAGLVSLHVAALGVIDKTPLLAVLSLH
ncbi:hypothetical protein ABZS66_28005 [Dactylosporangium sp. NPDC005572]|uniref:hypothetical protein n=1 Tax=Dactylosporangium sp. NPDC005572 TaxID=3156889 RepID=UPI0033A7DF95